MGILSNVLQRIEMEEELSDPLNDPSVKAGLTIHHINSSFDQLFQMIALGGVDREAVALEYNELRKLATRLENLVAFVRPKERVAG